MPGDGIGIAFSLHWPDIQSSINVVWFGVVFGLAILWHALTRGRKM